MTKYVILNKDKLVEAFCEPVGLDPRYVRRVVVDMEVGSAARVYFDTFGDDATVDLILQGGGIEIVERDDEVAA